MKKCTFYRTVYNPGKKEAEATKTEGFCETVKDKDGNEITLCFHRESDFSWCVTEKTTGFRLCSGNTRKNALEKAMEGIINIVYEKTHDTNCEKYVELIKKAYEAA